MKKVHLIGNAHIDPVWLWRKPEGMSEILATFRSALDRMNEFQDYVFTSACAGYYGWVEKVDKTMFAEIKKRVAEGRWNIAGGFWIQPDCNIPAGESFARHLLYSQGFFRERFGIMAQVGYNVDSFGHNGMLPQIFAKAGMENYVFMRPDSREKPGLPGDVFIWESPDDSSVAAFRISQGYGTPSDANLNDWEPEKADSMPDEDFTVTKALKHLEKAESEGLPVMCFYGVGNHGGGPTIKNIDALAKLCEENKDIGFSSVDEYFKQLRETGLIGSLPKVREDLQHHASGCYAANSTVKAANRKAEQALMAAEKYDVLAHALTDCESMRERLKPAWEKVMFNQFHDILAGCSIRDAYAEALDEFAAARDAAAEMTDLAVHRISWRICTTKILDGKKAQKNGWALWEKEGEGSPVVVFNPHSFPVSAPMQINATVAGVSDREGAPVPCQQVRGPQTNGQDRFNTIFTADVPALGYATYYIYRNRKFGGLSGNAVSVTKDSLENDLLKVTFNKAGFISGFLDKETGYEIAGGPMARPVVIDDKIPDTWSHNIFTFDTEIGCFMKAEARVLDLGPVRGGLRITSVYGGSTLVQDFYVYPGRKELEVRCRLDFREKLKILKLCFPVNAVDPEAVYSMPFGFIKKEPDGCEEPSQEWAGVCGKASGKGLALLNDGRYSFCVKGNEMRMVAARGCIYADHYGKRDDLVEYQDQGEHFFSYVLMPYSQTNPSDVVRRAMVLNRQPVLIAETHHGGDLDPSYSGISITGGNVTAQAVKFSEKGDGYIIRLLETSGGHSEAEIDFAPAGARFKVKMKPQEFKTYLVPKDGGIIEEVYLTEEKMR